MFEKVKKYYQLKQKQKETEQELAGLRTEILAYCAEQEAAELTVGRYKVKIVAQERREYDEAKLLAALPEPDACRLVSKVDPSKVSSLLQLNIISETSLQDTFTTKKISLLQVDKL